MKHLTPFQRCAAIGLTALLLIAAAAIPVGPEYDTLNDLLAHQPVPNVAAKWYNLKGRTTIGDGGGGTFYWVNGSTTTTNAGTVFRWGNGRLVRQYDGPLFAKWFGALGKGVSDDTTAVQAAITFAIGTGEILHFTEGIYLVHKSLNCTGGLLPPIYRQHIHITGDGYMSTIIQGDGSQDGGSFPVLDMAGQGKSVLSDITIWALNNVPSACLLIGRVSGNPSCGDMSFTRVRTVGDAKIAGFFSLSSEVNIYDTCFFTTDAPTNPMRPVILASNPTDWGMVSKYVTLGTGVGGNGFHNFKGGEISANLTQAGVAGAAASLLTIQNAQAVTLDGLFMHSNGSTNQIELRETINGLIMLNVRQEWEGLYKPSGLYLKYNPTTHLGHYNAIVSKGSSIVPPVYADDDTWLQSSEFANTTWIINFDQPITNNVAMSLYNAIDNNVYWSGGPSEVQFSHLTNATFVVRGVRNEKNRFPDFQQYTGSVDFPSFVTNGVLTVRTNARVAQHLELNLTTNSPVLSYDVQIYRVDDGADIGLWSTGAVGQVKFMLQAGNGTAFAGDPGFRIYDDGSGNERMRINTNGDLMIGNARQFWFSRTGLLGIGTTNPIITLDLSSSTGPGVAIRTSGVGGRDYLFQGGNDADFGPGLGGLRVYDNSSGGTLARWDSSRILHLGQADVTVTDAGALTAVSITATTSINTPVFNPTLVNTSLITTTNGINFLSTNAVPVNTNANKWIKIQISGVDYAIPASILP